MKIFVKEIIEGDAEFNFRHWFFVLISQWIPSSLLNSFPVSHRIADKLELVVGTEALAF